MMSVRLVQSVVKFVIILQKSIEFTKVKWGGSM